MCWCSPPEARAGAARLKRIRGPRCGGVGPDFSSAGHCLMKIRSNAGNS
jgi:hypothetical protein